MNHKEWSQPNKPQQTLVTFQEKTKEVLCRLAMKNKNATAQQHKFCGSIKNYIMNIKYVFYLFYVHLK